VPAADRRKWAALLAAAEHHVLRVETAQEEHAEAAKDIAAAADWSAIAKEIRTRAYFYSAQPWLKRVAS